MFENFNYLFQYLEREQINIDINEFEFQIQSHPDYPSFISVVDTLSFFNIDNGVLSVEITEIELLPDYFVTLLEIENNQAQFYLVEKKGDVYFCVKDKNKTVLSKQELELKWKDIVLLVEKSETDTFAQTNKSKLFWVLPTLCIGLFFLTILQFQISIATYSFFMFPILGVLFSVAALKDLFGTKSELLNRFCNVTASTSCTSVVGSNKWKIFEVINFSDLSLVFFSSQFFGLLTFLFMGNITVYFSIQKIILVCGLPVLLTSIYYQKFVEKKWCPICLIIIGVNLFELGYVMLLTQYSFDFQINFLIVFSFILVTTAFSWFKLRKLLTQQKELKEFQIKGNRFMRNYEIFKNNLLAANSVDNSPMLSEETIVLGNPEASLKIIIVTSPFCGFCAEAHTIIKEIVGKYFEKVCFDIRFNFNEANDNQKSEKIHQQLVSIYFNQGQETFMKALHSWFENKDETAISKIASYEMKNAIAVNQNLNTLLEGNELNILENSVINELQLNLIMEKQFNWNQLNRINFTPAIIINGYFLPKQYDKSDLIHFINDLSEDEDFHFVL